MVEQSSHSSDGMSMLLRYTGPSVRDGKMNVYEAAGNMVAFSDFVVLAAHAVYGDEAEVKAEVTAFNRGSFETDLLFHVAGAGAAMWAASPDIGGLLTTIKESLGLWRFLRGTSPKKVEHLDNRKVQVTNNNGNVTIVQTEALQITLDARAGKFVERFIAHALSQPGVESMDVQSDSAPLIGVEQSDAQYYRAIDGDDYEVTETTVKMSLAVEQPGFRDGLKWKFWDGEHAFTAGIEDLAFLAVVDAGEPFRKGDTMICDVRIRQSKTASGALRLDRSVVKVIKHEKRPDQTSLLAFFDPEVDE